MHLINKLIFFLLGIKLEMQMLYFTHMEQAERIQWGENKRSQNIVHTQFKQYEQFGE